MIDFAVLPPEVNSGRLYAGAGAGPLLAGAAAWDSLASELSAAASSYQSVVTDLTGGGWLGPSATAMAAAAAPYVAWMNTTAGQAEQTAAQAKAAAAAYQTAFAGVVPPAVITANRTLLASLVATNLLGQNTPAIAATETQYAEMWAQDAVAMYGYAGAASAATQLTPFDQAPQTTNPAGSAAQSGAVSQANGTGGVGQALSQVPNALQSLASPAQAAASPADAIGDILSDPLVQAVGELLGVLGNDYGFAISAIGFVGCLPGFFVGPLLSLALPEAGALPAAFAATASDASGAGLGADLATSLASGGAGAGVSAGMGEAATLGGLSVPPTWGSAPAIRLASAEMPLAGAGLGAVPEAGMGAPGGMVGGIPPVGSVVNAPRNGEGRLRPPSRARVIPAIAAAPGAHHDAVLERGPQASRPGPEDAGSLTDQERAELDALRDEMAELAMERDAAARLIREAIR